MKKVLILSSLIYLLSCGYDQKRKPSSDLNTLPSFEVLLMDSTTIFSTEQITLGKPTIFIYFNTDCEHCQHETELLINNIHSLKNAQLYFLTGMSNSELQKFSAAFHLNEYKNITVGTDHEHSFYRIFKPQAVPFIAIYDGQGKLRRIYKGTVEINTILKAINI